MRGELAPYPATSTEAVVDCYHGVAIVDHYRWLEDQDSARTRSWISQQTAYARGHLDAISCRRQVRERIEELLAVESIPELHYVSGRCLFLRRGPNDQQAKLYVRLGLNGEDRLLLDPIVFDSNHTISISILDVTPDGRLLALGLRTGGHGGRTVRILDTDTATLLADALPTGVIRGFSFSPCNSTFLYVLEQSSRRAHPNEAKLHTIGDSVGDDRVVFCAGSTENTRLTSYLDPASHVAVYRVIKRHCGQVLNSAVLQDLGNPRKPPLVLWDEVPRNVDIRVSDGELWWRFEGGPIVSTSLRSPNVNSPKEVVPSEEISEARWSVAGGWLLIQTVENYRSVLRIRDCDGTSHGEVLQPGIGTATVLSVAPRHLFYAWESFASPSAVYVYDLATRTTDLFSSSPSTPLPDLVSRRVWAIAKDGVQVPITIVGLAKTFDTGAAPTLLTGYGSSGVSLTPRYSQLANLLIESGGLLALAHIRGGGELGRAWKDAGTRHHRPTVFADFISCAECLIRDGFTQPGRLAIAGGSNSGLLVGAAMTIRPQLFRVVLCLAPILDMLRYHLFRNTQFYVAGVGSSENAEDFPVLASYSPYHRIRDGESYPAVLMVSGDADTRCDAMHARKYVARLQTASASGYPVLLDYSEIRGHWPTLPLALRVEALADRVAFLFDELSIDLESTGTGT